MRDFQPRSEPGVVLLHPQPIEVFEVNLHRRLEDAMRRFVGIGDEDMTLDADDHAAGKFRFRLRRCAALGKRILERLDVGLGHRCRAERHVVQSVLAGPRRADFAR